jgi:hypothetical protein
MGRSKRNTVRRELKKRLSEAKRFLNYAPHYNDLVNVLGGNMIESQAELNAKTDIQQLEFLLWCLDNKKTIEEKFSL